MNTYTMILKYDGTTLGRILTNHGLTIEEALDLLGIDMDKYAAEQGWDGWDYEQLSLELEEDKNDHTEQEGRITLADIEEELKKRIDDAKDEEDREEAVRDAKRAAFNLGALDAYARWTKQPQNEFWHKERENDGGYYKVWGLPDFCRADGDDFSDLEDAYDAGEDEGVDAAERYEQEVLPRELENAKSMLEETKGETRSEFAEAESECDRIWTRECLDNYRMLKERMDSDECGWGENWWNR